MPNEQRIVPHPTGLNAEFFAHCARGELRFQRCRACDAWRHPPRYRCGACGSGAWTWERSTGRGRIFSWTVTHQVLDPAFAADAPYAIVVVELDEGPRLVGNLLDLDPSDLELELPVEVVLEPVAENVALTQFRPHPLPPAGGLRC